MDVGNALEDPFDDAALDTISLYEVLDHISVVSGCIRAVWRGTRYKEQRGDLGLCPSQSCAVPQMLASTCRLLSLR